MITIEDKIAARKKLVMSAKLAKKEGYSMYEWETSEVVRKFVLNSGLDSDILEHVSTFVWTFKRK